MKERRGIKAENYFSAILNKNGIQHEYVDSWYDFDIINKSHRVEVKSCQVTIRDGNKSGYRIGRFDFTDEDNRKKQFKENVWVCLIVRHFDQFLIYGFLRARSIDKKRYLTIHEARFLRPIGFENWLKMINP